MIKKENKMKRIQLLLSGLFLGRSSHMSFNNPDFVGLFITAADQLRPALQEALVQTHSP
jgi:hypothetical protein